MEWSMYTTSRLFTIQEPPLPSFALLILSTGRTSGLPCRACAFRKASVIMGELSVRIIVPMDIKHLEVHVSDIYRLLWLCVHTQRLPQTPTYIGPAF